MKVTYANGDVYSASDVNDTNGTINLLGSSVAYAAGKNKIINGDFYINQRAFTSTTTNDVYTFDRWGTVIVNGGGSVTVSTQAFTLGTAPVSGYEGTNFCRIVTASQSTTASWGAIKQKMESVRTFAGQTVTVSFWAKVGSGTLDILPTFQQEFGTGGSPSSTVYATTTKKTITTSWARYTWTFTIPSIAGKTIGTNNNNFLMLLINVSMGTDYSLNGSLGVQNGTFDVWGVQVESGSTATAFQTATGTIQGELAACQRYYIRYGGNSLYEYLGMGMGQTATAAGFLIAFPVQMRVPPTSIEYQALALYDATTVIGSAIPTLVATTQGTKTVAIDGTVASGVTANRPYRLITNNSTSSYVALNAEL
jgi:hypothetical protein